MPATALSLDSIREPSVHTGSVCLPDPFVLMSGERMFGQSAEYVLTGPEGAPVVVVMGGISANRHAADGEGRAGWWRGVVGPGRPIDTNRLRVLGIDWLGSRAGCLAASDDLAPPPDRAYPLISTHDQARSLAHVLDDVGIGRVATLVGASYGGMVALAFATDFPGRTGHLVVISAAHRTHPMATAHRAIQRDIVSLARECGRARDGLALARALAMTTYRTIDEFEARFNVAPTASNADRFDVEEYLRAQGRKFQDRFDPDVFRCLSHSIDLHHLDPARITVSADLVSVDSDTLVPDWLMTELEHGFGGSCRHHRLTSRFGHDAFLKEDDTLGPLLSEILHLEGRAS